MNTTSNSGYDRDARREAAIERARQEDAAGQEINAPAIRRWINDQYEGAASCANWSLAECVQFVEEHHVDGLAPFLRTVIREDLVANTRTPNQVKAAVASLNRKLARSEHWRGQSISLYRTRAALEDGVIVVRMTEPDRTLTDQPDKVWAEGFLDVNMGAHTLYRHARRISGEGTHAAIQTYLKDGLNTYGPTPASPDSWDAK